LGYVIRRNNADKVGFWLYVLLVQELIFCLLWLYLIEITVCWADVIVTLRFRYRFNYVSQEWINNNWICHWPSREVEKAIMRVVLVAMAVSVCHG